MQLYWVAFGAPQPAGVVRESPRRLAIDVFAEKRLPYPAPLGISPDEVNGIPNETVVNAGTWLWIPAGEWHSVSVTATILDYLSVTATGRPVALTWRMSDGGSVTCDGPGTPYDDAAGNDPSPTCNDVYTRSTPVGPITASITWQVAYTWQYAGGGSGTGTLPDVITSATGRPGGGPGRDHQRPGALMAKNLRDWPESATSPGPVGASAPVDTEATVEGGTDPGSDRGMTHGQRSDRKTRRHGKASRAEARTEPGTIRGKNLERAAA